MVRTRRGLARLRNGIHVNRNFWLPRCEARPVSAVGKSGKRSAPAAIARNRRAKHDYRLEERFEAGLALEGWEVKSLRAGKAQMTDSYVLLKEGEAWLLGLHLEPLASASTHIDPDPRRTRKLLLHTRELAKIFSATRAKGYACIATKLYWKGDLAKCEIALGKGKQRQDKRATQQDRDWARQRERLLKARNRP